MHKGLKSNCNPNITCKHNFFKNFCLCSRQNLKLITGCTRGKCFVPAHFPWPNTIQTHSSKKKRVAWTITLPITTHSMGEYWAKSGIWSIAIIDRHKLMFSRVAFYLIGLFHIKHSCHGLNKFPKITNKIEHIENMLEKLHAQIWWVQSSILNFNVCCTSVHKQQIPGADTE